MFVLQRVRQLDVAQQMASCGDRCGRDVRRDILGVDLHVSVVVFAAGNVELLVFERDVCLFREHDLVQRESVDAIRWLLHLVGPC